MKTPRGRSGGDDRVPLGATADQMKKKKKESVTNYNALLANLQYAPLRSGPNTSPPDGEGALPQCMEVDSGAGVGGLRDKFLDSVRQFFPDREGVDSLAATLLDALDSTIRHHLSKTEDLITRFSHRLRVLEEQVSNLEGINDRLEQQLKKTNVVLRWLPESPTESEASLGSSLQAFFDSLSSDAPKVVKAYRMGARADGYKRPVLIQFQSEEMKIAALRLRRAKRDVQASDSTKPPGNRRLPEDFWKLLYHVLVIHVFLGLSALFRIEVEV
ncbi:hypothetical protein BSKO_09571 [Bryopsis sp. KO-2023]|nr:hypothetical protein BSKO_09571 [Bryopsis sp. KO-2023]